MIIKTVPVRDGLRRWGPVLDSILGGLTDLPITVQLAETPDVLVEEISDLHDAGRVAQAHAAQVRTLAADPRVAAVATGCLLEPGLDACHGLPTPVTGEIEASVRWLTSQGHRVGFVTSSAGAAEGIRERLRIHGLTDQVAAVRAIEESPLAFTSAQAHQRIEAEMTDAARAVRAAGASSAVGYGSRPLLAAVSASSGLELWSPVEASIRWTAELLDLPPPDTA